MITGGSGFRVRGSLSKHQPKSLGLRVTESHMEMNLENQMEYQMKTGVTVCCRGFTGISTKILVFESWCNPEFLV